MSALNPGCNSDPWTPPLDPSGTPLFLDMPWFTSFIRNTQSRLDMLPDDFKTMARDLLLAFHDAHLNSTYCDIVQNRSTFQPNQKSAGPLPSLLFGFRFLDIVSLLGDVEAERTSSVGGIRVSPSVPKSRLEGDTAKLRGIAALGGRQGWPCVIEKVDQLLRMDRPVSDPTLPPSELGSSLSQQLLFAALRQINTIKDRDDSLSLRKHLYNLEVAAFFINWLIRGNIDFPSQTKDLFERLECDVLNAGVSDTFPVDYLRVAHDKWTTDKDSFPDVTKLRQPLFLALAVSPLILVSDITTTTNNLSRIQLLRAWFHYGNQRPPILAKVEYVLWQELLLMARGLKTSREALKAFVDKSLPLLPGASAERYFFAPNEGPNAVMPIGICYKSAPGGEPAPVLNPRYLPSLFPSSRNYQSFFSSLSISQSLSHSLYRRESPLLPLHRTKLLLSLPPTNPTSYSGQEPLLPEVTNVNLDTSGAPNPRFDSTHNLGDDTADADTPGTSDPLVDPTPVLGDGDVELDTSQSRDVHVDSMPIVGDDTCNVSGAPFAEGESSAGQITGGDDCMLHSPDLSGICTPNGGDPIVQDMPDFLIELAGLIERAGGDTNDGTVLSSTGGPADEQDVSQHSMVSGDKPVVEHVQDGTATVDSSSSVDPVDLESNEQVVGPRRSGRTTSKVKKSYCDAPDDDDLDDALGVSVRRVASQSRSLGGTLEHPGQGSLSKPSRLAVDSNKKRVWGDSYLLFAPDGRYVTYRPSFYTLSDLHDVDELFARSNWYQLNNGAKELFIKLTDRSHDDQLLSSIMNNTRGTSIKGLTVMSSEEFNRLDREQRLLPILGSSNIYVRGSANSLTTSMSKVALMNVGSCSLSREAHDLSLRGDTDDPIDQIVTASFIDYLHEVEKGANGKILNFLDIPASDDKYATPSLSTNMYSHRYTLDFPSYDRAVDVVPIYDLNWHLLATAHATHPAHIDANGFNTEILLETGVKLIFLGCPPPSDRNFLARHDAFSAFEHNLTGPESHGIIGLLLLPGDRIVLRPGTPHYVVTLEPALCHGAHFYAVDTMEQTIWSIIHTFFRDHEITNNDHPSYHRLLLRIFVHWHDVIVNSSDDYFAKCKEGQDAFPHIPNVSNLHGLLQLFSLVNLIEMGTLLLGSRYDEGHSDPTLEDTYENGRVLSAAILDTLASFIAVQVGKSASISVKDIARSYLVQQLVGLVNIAKAANHSERSAAVLLILMRADLGRDLLLRSEVNSVLEGHKARFGYDMVLDGKMCCSLKWAFAERFGDRHTISILSSPTGHKVVGRTSIKRTVKHLAKPRSKRRRVVSSALVSEDE